MSAESLAGGVIAAGLLIYLMYALLRPERFFPPGGTPEPIFRAGDLTVDLVKRQVFRADQEVHLTPTEYKLLVALIRHAGKLLTHRQLLHEVWGSNYITQTHYLRIYVMQLRQKIEPEPTRPRLLLTEPGVGYRFKAD